MLLYTQLIKSTIVSFVFVIILSSCGNGDVIIQDGDPVNLVVQVNVSNDGSGRVTIQASAENAIEYQFRIGSANEPVETNTTGLFEHTFIKTGNYELDIRAYGASGRFLREVIHVPVTVRIEPVLEGFVTPLTREGYTLVWNDEFGGTQINELDWVFEIGTGCPHLCGWGNDELQYYRRENAWVEGGVLVIEARREAFGGRSFTSTRMKTQGRRSFQYGRIDIRAKLPMGQGMWPALWMLGNDITTVGWPRCGEIDIMEMVGGRGRENTVHGTVHWFTDRHVHAGGSHTLPAGRTLSDEYRVFSITWDASLIRFFINDTPYYTIDITPDHMTEFHQPFFFIFNIAVGGRWPGSPDGTTIFPQQMRVDYVRVFRRN